MPLPLLETKFYAPPPPHHLVARARLLSKLNAGRKGKLTLVAAPAGFGKTTLVAAWLQQTGVAVAWLSLDAGDNDPHRFVLYLVEALQRAAPSMGQEARTLLRLPQAPPVEHLLTALLNDLAATPHDLILVLDDYHVIDAQPVHAALTFLLDHLPPQLHLVMTSRANPPLPLSRLRGQGKVAELRAAEIRFTLDEAIDFFQQFTHLALARSDLFTLAERTEGWIVGLQLAAISLEQRADAASFIQNFSGSNRFILDYLIEEVLEQRPPEIQTFLLYTSILDRMCAPLCAAVMGDAASHTPQGTLQQLEQANLFITPLDDERYWYRYHHLFAEVLRQQLRHASPEMVAMLHQRASIWFEAQGLIDEAIAHARSANDLPRVTLLVEQEVQSLIMRGYFDNAIRWMGTLPPSLIGTRPRLSLTQAWLRLLEIPIGDVEASVRQAEHAWSQLGDQGEAALADFRGEVAAVRALLAGYAGQHERAVALAQEAFQQISLDNYFVRSTVAYMLISLDPSIRDWESTRHTFQSVIANARAGSNVVIASGASYDFAMLQAEHGDLQAAYQGLQEAETFARSQPNLWPWSIVDSARIGMGQLFYEWGDLEGAQRLLLEGVELATQRRNLHLIIDGYITLAWVFSAQGESALAQDALRQAFELAPKSTLPHTPLLIMATQLRFWIAQGDSERATVWAAENGLALDAESDPSGGNELRTLTLVRLLLVQDTGQDKEGIEQALALLKQLEGAAQGWRGRLVRILLLQSHALAKLGRASEANKSLQQALALGEAAGYLRRVVDEGAWVATHLAQRPPTPYGDQLLAAFGQRAMPVTEIATPSNKALTHPSLVEPISERELEVIRLVVAGASNKEIADQLIITVGTVKNHMSNILGKLGVRNRWEVRDRVGELGLL